MYIIISQSEVKCYLENWSILWKNYA